MALSVVEGGQLTDDWRKLRSAVPDIPGNYLWCIRAPKAKTWVPVYIGKAGGSSDATLRSRLEGYIQEGSVGPIKEPTKHAVFIDAMSRGFAIEIRCGCSLPGYWDCMPGNQYHIHSSHPNKSLLLSILSSLTGSAPTSGTRRTQRSSH